MPTPRRSMRSFSLRTLLVFVGLVCCAGAVVRIHLERVERIRAIRHCIAMAGGKSVCHEGFRCFQYADELTFDIQLDPARWNSESPAWIERACLLLKLDSRHRVERLMFRGTNISDAEAIRAAIDRLRPEELRIGDGLPQEQWQTLVARYHCRSIYCSPEPPTHSTPPIVLYCEWTNFRSCEQFLQISAKSTIRKVAFSRLTTNEILSLKPPPSIRELSLRTGEVDECDVCQLMSRWPGVKIQLECNGLGPAEVDRLEQAFEPWLELEAHPYPPGPPVDPFG